MPARLDGSKLRIVFPVEVSEPIFGEWASVLFGLGAEAVVVGVLPIANFIAFEDLFSFVYFDAFGKKLMEVIPSQILLKNSLIKLLQQFLLEINGHAIDLHLSMRTSDETILQLVVFLEAGDYRGLNFGKDGIVEVPAIIHMIKPVILKNISNILLS